MSEEMKHQSKGMSLNPRNKILEIKHVYAGRTERKYLKMQINYYYGKQRKNNKKSMKISTKKIHSTISFNQSSAWLSQYYLVYFHY